MVSLFKTLNRKYCFDYFLLALGLCPHLAAGQVVYDNRLFEQVEIITSPGRAMLYLNGKKLGLSPQTLLIERTTSTSQLVTALPLDAHHFKQEVKLSIGEAPDQVKIFMDIMPKDYKVMEEKEVIAKENDAQKNSTLTCSEHVTSATTFYFATNEFTLTEDQKTHVVSLYCKLAGFSNPPVVTIIGGADETGNFDQNNKLSLKRAMSIKKALVAQGYSKDLVNVQAYGETRLIDESMSTLPLQQNRRAFVHINLAPLQ